MTTGEKGLIIALVLIVGMGLPLAYRAGENETLDFRHDRDARTAFERYYYVSDRVYKFANGFGVRVAHDQPRGAIGWVASAPMTIDDMEYYFEVVVLCGKPFTHSISRPRIYHSLVGPLDVWVPAKKVDDYLKAVERMTANHAQQCAHYEPQVQP